MDIHYRLATLEDAEDIHHIKRIVWPDEASNPDHIHTCLSLANHTCYVAVAENHVVGFMDCFATSHMNILRMEMDLLAVLPDYQGNGIASRLIRLCLYHPHTMQPALYRSLIQVNNIASQKSFQHNNFILQPETLTLYIASVEDQETLFKRKGFSGTIIPVQTYNYEGHWIEAPFSKGNINIPDPGNIVGTILPQDEELMKQAQQAGFLPVANYQWWVLNTPLPPAISQFAN
jgi:ribosomal protein S18 acetylase RimI-like enzyme